MSKIIIAENIHKSYDSLEVLKGVSLEIEQGEVVAITGASGAGKSTLLHILATLSQCETGSVVIDGADITKMGDVELSKFRNEKIGFVFQFHNLLPEFSALENVMMPAMIGGASRSACEKKAVELLDLMRLADRKEHKPSQLSGGEQQRVAIARALVNSPSVIFADEPSGNLDSQNRREIHNLFFELRDKFGQTFVVVTHDDELAHMSDRQIVMCDGLIL